MSIIKILSLALSVCLLGAVCPLAQASAGEAQDPVKDPAQESYAGEAFITYDNDVEETIKAQLQGLPMDSVRKKSGLIMERSIDQLQQAVTAGQLTYTELTAFYLDRILRHDKGARGLNAVVQINPQAIAQAQQKDEGRTTGQPALYGIPLLIKDNINTRDMNTTGGTVALWDFQPKEDAEVIKRLQESGAILLGKANLSELANFLDESMPSGYSGRLGQTHNPFDPDLLSPLGSSSGSGASVAANFAAAALGSETTGSIISPSFVQSLVGFKPSLGRISTKGVLPLSSSMDTIGPMAKTVSDAVLVYNAAVQQPADRLSLSENQQDLAGLRIGLVTSADQKASQALQQALESLGATVVPVELPHDEGDNEFIILQEFAADFAAYAKAHQAPVDSLKDLIDFNKKDPERRIRFGQGLVEAAAAVILPDAQKVKETVKKAQDNLSRLFLDHQLNAVAFSNSDAVGLPCAAGAPIITLPFGLSEYNEPQGASFFAKPGEDSQLVNLALVFERLQGQRLIPEKYLAPGQP